jgi:hypothetical protein
MVTWIGASLANKGVGCFDVAGEPANRAIAAKNHRIMGVSFSG